MRLKKIHFILIMILVLLLGVANVCAVDVEDVNSTQTTIDSSISVDNDYQLEDNSPIQLSDDSPQISVNEDNQVSSVESDDSPQISVNEDNQVSSGESDEIEVETWEDIQYYSSLTDKNYVLKLKENTNYYPTSITSIDGQVVFNNNVTIIGAEGAYIGDSSPVARNITYTAMIVPDNSGVGINFQGVTFKWIGTRYQPDGVFLQMGGNAINYFTDCYITNCSVNLGHSSILYIKLGDAIIDNCTFINCTTDFGCLSVYNPDDDPTKTCTKARMNVTDSYFEGNYARTEPGCINNCGMLVVSNSTFHNNSAFWWAGAIHTHGGANTTLYDCTFTDNVAGWNGGALYTYSYLQIYRCIFLGNNCTTNNGGGAIGACKYLHAPYIYIEDSLFENNENTCWGVDELSDGTGRGGAISIMDQGALEVRNTTFIKNSASMGTAICAINGGLQMGSPDVIIVGNRFINHTRVGDVLDIRLATGSYCEIRDNYYYNNSFEFKKLRLLAGEKIGNDYVVNIDAELTNPNSFESDILDTTDYDVYVDGVYNKTVTGRTFTLHLEDGETCNVYVIPCISDSVSNQILVGVPKEYIYVSQQSGKNTNDGLTRLTPVKTITKAIELARTKGNIIIMDGTFSESNLTIDYNLSITGENNVKFTGNIPINVQTIFTVTNYSDLSLKGITFDNIVFTANTTYKNKRVILQDSGYLTIEDCTFSRISPSGNTAMNLIESPNVEVYNSIFTNNNKASVYVVLIKSNEFLIDNCTFTNNIASYSSAAALISTVNTKTGVKGTVTNSLFENNKVKYGCIYFGSNGKPLTVTNTKFIANTVGGTSDHASCIKVEESTTLRVDSSVFKDNINLGTRAAVIYCSGSSGSIFVTNSIVVNNSYANNNHVVFSASTANNLKAYKNLNGNWWGHTLENYTIAPAVYESACNNWVVLNTTANVTTLGTNQSALVFFDLNNAYDKEFNESFYDAKYLPSFDLDIKTTGGISNVNKVSVDKGRGSVIYTLQSTDGGSLTASYANVESIINFTWSIVDPEISVYVDDITYGENAVINLTLPSDISLSDISLTLNGNSLNAQNAITISDLNAGDYVLNLTYPGNSKYNPFNLAKTFTVNKADPQLTVNVPSEVYYGNPVSIEVNTLADVEGTVTVDAGNATASGTLSNGRRIFSLSGFEANNYTVVATYAGNDNYLSGNATANFVVKKINSTISISNGTVELGKNVVLTFNVNSDADGTITVVVDGNAQTVNVENGQATYTINKITRGLHNIEATYNGNAKYLPSNASIQLDVARFDPNLAISVSDISFGQDAIVQISLANAATGNVTVTVDGKTQTVAVEDGEAVVAISGVTVGNNKVVEVNYSGNTLYAPSYKTANFNVAKGESVITISAPNIREGQVATIQITLSKDATGTLVLNYAGISENVNIPRTGLITRTLSDLAVGTYSISASYAGDSNYLSSSATKSFNVEEWVDAQWPNEGYDVQNSANSPYSSNANGYVKWNVTLNGNVIGNMVIDSNGYIYILTDNGIYSYTYAGRFKWNFNSQDAGANFSGIAVGRDVVISPKSEDKLYFINQTTGQKYSNNMYQGSSIFVPVIDEDANIYITSEYQYSEACYNLVIVPYQIWQTSTVPTLISLGQHEPTTAPVIINNELVAIGSEDGLIIVDLSSESIIGIIDDVITNQRPVVGPDGLIYAIADNLVMAVDPVEGVQWAAEINGTPGNNLVVDGEYVYSVTKEGILYQYYYGEESLVYNFTENITSSILMGNNGVLYIGSESGTLYAINLTGNLLWKVNLDGPITGSPVMDKNGVIYLIAGDKLYAISSSRLIDPNLSATASNAVYGEDVAIDVELDSGATGRVSVTIGNEFYDAEVKDGKVSFSISDLNAGSYNARIYYSGDSRFKQKSMNVPFTVGKADVNLITTDKNINVGETLRITVTNFTSFATGTVTLSVGGKTATANVISGQASLAVSGLAKGHYNYVITYSGDNNYNEATISKSVSVGYEATSFTATTSAISVGQTAVVTVSGLPSDAAGVTYIMLNGQNYSAAVSNGGSTISIPDLLSGTYRLDVRYTNDAKYMANPKVITLKVKKVNPSMAITARDISVGSELAVTVTLNSDASGSVAISVGGITNNVTVTNGVASTSFAGLSYGSYVVNVSYSGDDKYNPRVADNKVVNVNKVTPSMTISANKYSLKVGETFEVSAALNSDVTGDVVFTVGDDSITVAVNNGVASASFSGLKAGTYTLNVSYSGDDKYNPRFVDSKTVTVTKYDVSMSVNPIDLIYVGENLTITVNNLPSDGAPFAYLMGDLSGQTEIKNGVATFVIPDLAAGEYTFSVYYPGNDKYNNNTISNLKATVKDKEDIIIRSSNIVMEYGGRTDYIVEVSDNDGNKLENVILKIELNGNTYNRRTNENGTAAVLVYLDVGRYDVNVSFAGNRSHNKASVSNTITITLAGTTLTAEDISMQYGDGTTYDIKLTDSKNKAISNALIKVTTPKGVSEYTTDNKGMVSVPLSNINPGTYVISATYEGEGNYSGANITNNLVINKGSVKLIANNITKGFIDEVNFTVRLTDSDDNPISGVYVTVHNSVRNFKYKTDADGYVSVPISLRISNTPYVFTSTFAGNSFYEAATITNNVIVGKSDVILTASDVEMDYKDGTMYVVRFTDGNGKPINNALINVYNTLGNYRYRTDADGYIYSDKLNFLKPGEYEISAFFTETSVYKGLRIYNNATINKAKTQLSVSNVTMIYGDGSTYEAVLTDINGKPISNGVVKVNDTLTVTKYKTNVNGSISAPINVGLGQHVFTAEFIGNALYEPCTATSKVIVNKNQITLSANDVNMVYRDGTSYLVSLVDSSGNPIPNALISVNNTLGVYKYRTNASGVAVAPLTNLKPGSYVITATYDGDEVPNPISISSNVLVKKIKTELSVSEISLDASSGKLRLTDANGNPIANYAIKVTDASGLHKYTTNATGFVSIPIDTSSNQYSFKATFDGNALYESVSLVSNVIISDKSIVLSAADINMYYNDGTNYVVRCTDGEGNPISNVQIKVNNTLGVYKYNTDSNGYISAPRTNLRPGEYVFTAVFEGNGQYDAVNVANNVVINKAKTKISVFDVDMNYNDGTNYIVKLTDVDENPISDVTVSINNGVSTYRYHTDENGMVSVPITLNAGEYTFTASFEGNALYESCTRDSSVVVRG